MSKKVLSRALVVLSGGQDSATAAAHALHLGFDQVDAVTFKYGQRHYMEVSQAKELFKRMEVKDRNGVTRRMERHWVLNVDNVFPEEDPSGLLNHSTGISQPHPDSDAMPISFVRGRNMTFFTIASNIAMAYGHSALFTGICQTDFSGYTDCREDFREAFERMQNIAYPNTPVRLHAPLMELDKAATWMMADKLGVLDLVLDSTLTCYEGDLSHNTWGYGCGECAACRLRKKGYAEFLAHKASLKGA